MTTLAGDGAAFRFCSIIHALLGGELVAADDLFVVRIQYDYLGKNMENVFFYFQETGTAGAGVLAAAVDTDLIPSIIGVQSDEVTQNQIDVVNLDDPTDFNIRLTGDAGGRVGDPMPAFVAWGFTLETTDRRIRTGGKRFGGVSETDVDSGDASTAALGVLATLTAALEADLENPGQTALWRLSLHTDGNVATSQAPLTVSVGSAPYRRVSTQSSRKVF